jgi:hypothetical protein
MPCLNEARTLGLCVLRAQQALDVLRDRHGMQLDIQQLIQLAGEERYIQTLVREAGEFADNGISAEQTGQLWNDAGRPAPGGGLWSRRKIEDLLATGA